MVNNKHPLARGLVTWWLSLSGLDGGSRLYDLAGSSHGVLTGLTTQGWTANKPRPGTLGPRISLGNYAVVQGPDNPGYGVMKAGGDWTVAYWAYTSSTFIIQTQVHVSIRGPRYNGFASAVGINGAWFLWCPNDIATSDWFMSWNQWYHFAISCRAGVIYRYRNAIPLTPVSRPGTFGTSVRGICIGNNPGGFDYPLTGSVDDLRFYARGLSDTDVRDLYDDSRLGCPALLQQMHISPPCWLRKKRHILILGGKKNLFNVYINKMQKQNNNLIISKKQDWSI